MTRTVMHASALPTHLNIGAVAYLNMQPLIAGLEDEPAVRLHLAPPRRLAAGLAAGELDIAMAPVAALFAHPDWRIVGRSMIGAHGLVRSVLACGGGPPEHWRVLRPDSHSRSSNALARIILHHAYRNDPETGPALPETDWQPPERLAPGEAFVLIGSRALAYAHRWSGQPGATVLDLGAAWRLMMGRPAVFALWAARPGIELGDWPERLDALRRRNLGRLEAIARSWATRAEDGLDADAAHDYLIRNIAYDFDADAHAGLVRFYEAGTAMGLFPAGWSAPAPPQPILD